MKQLLIFLLIFIITSVSFAQKPQTKMPFKIDTANAFKFNGQWIFAKRDFKLNTVANSLTDTLDLVTCSNFVFFPFGSLSARSDINKPLLKKFKAADKKIDGATNYWQFELTFNASKLTIQFDNDTEASMHSYIIGGEIKDAEVRLANNVQIGMSIDKFCSRFFTCTGSHVFDKIKVIVFESCVTDIAHVYIFKNKRLASIEFIKQ